ncbi:hypothetical protein AB1Y20_022742 [Prymnesium parvum]|uniref:Phospholipase B-like n=1 Tax=Prymnesium parvum TaxID=97485 RepID=A0AB34JGQ8_PRYPA
MSASPAQSITTNDALDTTVGRITNVHISHGRGLAPATHDHRSGYRRIAVDGSSTRSSGTLAHLARENEDINLGRHPWGGRVRTCQYQRRMAISWHRPDAAAQPPADGFPNNTIDVTSPWPPAGAKNPGASKNCSGRWLFSVDLHQGMRGASQ